MTDEQVLYDNIDELTGYFVEGAPAYLTTNINPSKHLANGTQVLLHSLTLPCLANMEAIRAKTINECPGTVIPLGCIPLSVNVRVSNINADSWSEQKTLISGDVVIPLKVSKRQQMLTRADGKRVRYHDFGFSIMLSVTYHKIQSKTVPYLILDLNHNADIPLSLQSLYVGISRVRSSQNLRIVPNISPSSDNWKHLIRLQHSEAYSRWTRSYVNHMFVPGQVEKTPNQKAVRRAKPLQTKPARAKQHTAVRVRVTTAHNNNIDHEFATNNVHNISQCPCSDAEIEPNDVSSISLNNFLNFTPSELFAIDQQSMSLNVDIDQYLAINNLFTISVPSDGHCLMHSWSVATGQSLPAIHQILRAEYISNEAFYLPFGITRTELECYLATNQYFLPSIDAVVNMLSNSTNTTIGIFGQKYTYTPDKNDTSFIVTEPIAGVTEFKQIQPRQGASNIKILLLKTGAHYDALIHLLPLQ